MQDTAKDTLMNRARERGRMFVAAATFMLAYSSPVARAQQEPAVLSGVQYLRTHLSGKAGEAAMIAPWPHEGRGST